jgi:hypothetical protein
MMVGASGSADRWADVGVRIGKGGECVFVCVLKTVRVRRWKTRQCLFGKQPCVVAVAFH